MPSDRLVEEYLRRIATGKDPVNPNARSDRWGNRILMSNDPTLLGLDFAQPAPPAIQLLQPAPKARQSATIVDTRQFELPQQFAIGVRFARNNPINNTAVLPFVSSYPFFSSTDMMATFQIRSSVDPMASLFVDELQMDQFPGEFPIDIVSARKLSIDVAIPGRVGVPTFTTVWVEVIASIASDIADRNKVSGWSRNANGLAGLPTFIASSAAPTVLCTPNPGRSQFMIVNTSTNADLLILLSPNTTLLPTWGPPIVGSLVLPRNQYATYESPIGGFSGGVLGIWNTAVPDGGAIVTQGAF